MRVSASFGNFFGHEAPLKASDGTKRKEGRPHICGLRILTKSID